jgi:hypothetical protein
MRGRAGKPVPDGAGAVGPVTFQPRGGAGAADATIYPPLGPAGDQAALDQTGRALGGQAAAVADSKTAAMARR